MDLKFYLSLFLRRIHWFLLFLALGTAAGVTVATILPPVYVARSVVVVESAQIPSDLAPSTVRTEAAEAIAILRQRVLTRESLLDMANRLGVYDDPGAGPRKSPDEIVSDLRDRITFSDGGRNSSATIVTVSFQAPSPQIAAAVPNEVVTMMLRENVELRTATAGGTLEFFQEEVARLDRELSDRSSAILAFQEANLDALPDSLDFRRSQQSALQERIQRLENEQAGLRERRARLVELYETTGQVAPVEQADLTPDERELARAREDLESALAVMSPQNPRVRILQTTVDQLEARVAAQAGATGDGGDAQLSAYELQLADIDGQIDAITAEVAQVEERMRTLQASIEATPGNAITLEQLQRDYDAVRSQYNQAVANRARAETGDTIEALAKGQRMTVIEQATPPGSPTSPNRPLIAAAGVGGGLALGLAVVFLLEFLNGAVRRPADIVSKLGITPFGTLPYIRTRREAARRRAIIAGAFVVALAVVPGGLWWAHTSIAPLDALLERVVDRLRPA